MALPAALRLTLAVTVDGTPVAGFPVERRPTGSSLERRTFVRQADGTDTVSFTLPTLAFPLQAAVLEAEAPVLVSCNSQEDDAVTLAAGGVMLMLNAGLLTLHLANPTETPAPCTLLGLTAP